ncbi:tRNA pseudouridine synthase A [Gottschalkia purinilytica]|uniref:tRNA pseudouridine synthase A n=1 Tax=Gottschalkia purinilytica TaxID=1503 RepID=A0A0L0W9D8_GOTPU|nr:tRNA pseudouridine(38-40) synthase TruA [Gottschalkia purinilytica]KNF08052.1 tRNA pseudouridine synthase A [Gottschalkia purinilytica]
MRNIKLIVEYDGTSYCGWQKQPNQPTIQETIENAIYKITKEDITLIGSGRTDSGVHALGQVANFYTNTSIPDIKIKDALNSVLPQDISIRESIEVLEDFHSRYSAVGKQYKYVIYNNKTRSPILRNYSYHVSYKLNIDNMERGLKYFIGTHDFCSFMSSGSSIEDTVRSIQEAYLNRQEEIIEIYIKGTGFLYNMVRIIVGTLVDIGTGKIHYSEVPKIIESKDRGKAGHTSPAKGLYLREVFY